MRARHLATSIAFGIQFYVSLNSRNTKPTNTEIHYDSVDL